MDKEALEKARKQLVAKRNDLVQNARQPLTKTQNEILMYMISKVKPIDMPGTLYTFRCSEFYALMGYVTNSYTDIKAMLSEMRKVNWWLDTDDEDGEDKNLTWFNIVHANPRKETITISFHEDVEPYIFQLVESNKYFSSYPFQYISLMKSFYSQKLYEQLNTHKYDKPKSGKKYPEWTYEIGTKSKHDLFIRIAQAAPELDQRVRWDRREKKTKVISKYDGFEPGEPMIPPGWSNFAIFKRDVLEPAIEEINTYTDMMVMYEPLKTDLAGNRYRRYTSIRFSWLLKSEGQIEDTERLIDSEYRKIEEDRANHQVTLDEYFGTIRPSLDERMDQLKKEQDELESSRKNRKKQSAQEKEEKAFQKRVENSDYPIATSEFGRDFKDDELKFLYSAAFQNLPAGIVSFENRENWLVDYVAHYKSKLDATHRDTRTKPYNRLLDMLKKDYDMVGAEYAERYRKKDPDTAASNSEAALRTVDNPAAEKPDINNGLNKTSDPSERAQVYLEYLENMRNGVKQDGSL